MGKQDLNFGNATCQFLLYKKMTPSSLTFLICVLALACPIQTEVHQR